MIQDKIFFDEKDPTGLSYNTPFTFYDSYAVSPELVSESSITGMKGVNYMELVPVLVKAIQELKAENDTLKSRIDTLEQA